MFAQCLLDLPLLGVHECRQSFSPLLPTQIWYGSLPEHGLTLSPTSLGPIRRTREGARGSIGNAGVFTVRSERPTALRPPNRTRGTNCDGTGNVATSDWTFGVREH